jgi:hypothetical protein
VGCAGLQQQHLLCPSTASSSGLAGVRAVVFYGGPVGLTRRLAGTLPLAVLVALTALLVVAGTAEANHKGTGVWALNLAETRSPLTDAEIQSYVNKGASMVMLQTRHLYGLGQSTTRMTGNLADPAIRTSSTYSVLRWLIDNQVVQRFRAKRIAFRLGFNGVNYYQPINPFHPWYNDAEWNTGALARLRELGAACKALGCEGFGIDLEEYPAAGGARHSLGYSSAQGTPQRARDEAKVRTRGRQVIEALAQGFGGPVKLHAYYVQLPGSYQERVRRACHGTNSDFRDKVDAMFYAGIAQSVSLARLDLWDAWFYKGTGACTAWLRANLPSATGRDDYQAIVGYALDRNDEFFRRLGVAGKVGYSNFTWIPDGPRGLCNGTSTEYDGPKPVDTVRRQLIAARDIGTTEHIGIYTGACSASWVPGWATYEPMMRAVVAHGGPPPPP